MMIRAVSELRISEFLQKREFFWVYITNIWQNSESLRIFFYLPLEALNY